MTTMLPPNTGKKLTVDTYRVVPRELLAWTRTRRNCTAKHISLYLLGQERSLRKAEAQDGGDTRHNNYALRIFENALDWSLGLAVLKLLAAYPVGRLPRPFTLGATRKGSILVQFPSGKIIVLLE